MGGVVAALSWVVGKIFADNLLRWVATKALVGTIVLVVLPIILNNVLYDLLDVLLGVATENLTGANSFDGTMTFSGLVGWFVIQFRIPECVSVLSSAMLFRLALSMIPLLRI